jgi:hypothetical protein
MCVYQIEVPEEQDTKAFSKFMQEEFLPSAGAPSEPTRAGQFTGAKLLKRTKTSGAEDAPEFILFVYWRGYTEAFCPDGAKASDDLLHKLESFGAHLRLVGAYESNGEVLEDYEG